MRAVTIGCVLLAIAGASGGYCVADEGKEGDTKTVRFPDPHASTTVRLLLETSFTVTSEEISPPPPALGDDIEVFWLVYQDAMPTATLEVENYGGPVTYMHMTFRGPVYKNSITDIERIALWIPVQSTVADVMLAFIYVPSDDRPVGLRWDKAFVYPSGTYASADVAVRIFEAGFSIETPQVAVTTALSARLGNGARVTYSREEGFEIRDWPEGDDAALPYCNVKSEYAPLTTKLVTERQADYLKHLRKATGWSDWIPPYLKAMPAQKICVLTDGLSLGVPGVR